MTAVKVAAKKSAAPGTLPVSLLIEALCAMHLSSYVDSPFHDRGGLFIVGPPSVLKSTLLEYVARNYSDAVVLSDVNARTLDDLREPIAAKSIRSLFITELRKLYERHSYTASNVEGTIRALAGEGFGAASFGDGRINQLVARATFLSALQPSFQQEHFKKWETSGFNRRFLWCLVRMNDPHIFERAVEEWERIEFGLTHIPMAPAGSRIPNTTTKLERRELGTLVRYQPGGAVAVQFQLLCKMLAVFKWWYKIIGRRERAALAAIRTFAPTLGREGAEIIL